MRPVLSCVGAKIELVQLPRLRRDGMWRGSAGLSICRNWRAKNGSPNDSAFLQWLRSWRPAAASRDFSTSQIGP